VKIIELLLDPDNTSVGPEDDDDITEPGPAGATVAPKLVDCCVFKMTLVGDPIHESDADATTGVHSTAAGSLATSLSRKLLSVEPLKNGEF